MESLKLSFEAITPIFLMMLLGYSLKRLRIADKKCFDSINRLVFKVFLPVLLFYNIYNTKTGEIFDFKLISFTVVGVLCVFIIGYFAVVMLTRDDAKRGVMLQGFFRANFAILGIPLVEYICGDKVIGLASLMVIPVAMLLGFAGEALPCLLVAFASPIAVSSFAMSQQMGGDEQLSAQVIVISSALCLVTLFAWIFVLSFLGMF